MVQTFKATLDKSNLSEKTKHEKVLEYLAENGIRALGPPLIGIYANKLRPEPLHCEINSWQDFLDLIYHESLVRDKYHEFISVLESAIHQNQESSNIHATKRKIVSEGKAIVPQGAGARVKSVECAQQQNSIFLATLENSNMNHNATVPKGVPGIGLPFIAKKVKEHHDKSKTCHNKLQVRLIGAQAIKLAQFYYRLVDILACENESEAQSFYG